MSLRKEFEMLDERYLAFNEAAFAAAHMLGIELPIYAFALYRWGLHGFSADKIELVSGNKLLSVAVSRIPMEITPEDYREGLLELCPEEELQHALIFLLTRIAGTKAWLLWDPFHGEPRLVRGKHVMSLFGI